MNNLYLLRVPLHHFECKNPEKFYTNIGLACERNNKDLNEVLKYYFITHYTLYLERQVLGNDNEVLEYAENMTKQFEKWLPENEVKECIEIANTNLKNGNWRY